uniref:Fibronectin type-III domain-containing protein n=1 Tax=Neogobius melanostomus TaxID=47308 RepID=A0A8C6WLM2_9GOBI
MLLLLLLWFLCLPCVPFAADKCSFKQSNPTMSSVLDSLQCYNDYKSYFHCKWKEKPETYSNRTLWIQRVGGGNGTCKHLPSDVEGNKECRYETTVFTTLTTYKAFFDNPFSVCSSDQPTPQDLSQLLRARTPVNVTTSSTEDRGRWITWSSPYSTSSALNKDIAYEVNYRPHGRDNWTTEELSDTQMKLTKKLIPGHGYEAKVRARVRPEHWSHWSHWSPIVSWRTPLDLEQAPRVDCVLEGSGRYGAAGSRAWSWVTPLATSCSVAPTTRPLRPYPPTQVNVTERGVNWVVKWTPAEIKDVASDMVHEVRYYSQKDEEDAVNISSHHPYFNIPTSSLIPSRKYWVKVRSKMEEKCAGPPSDWSPPVEWTPQAVTWPNWIYASVAVVVAVIFFTLFIVPICRKRVALWVQSVPSPYKSKVIIQMVQNPEVIVCEKTYLCKVMDMDSVSIRSTVVYPWPKKELDSQTEEAEDEGIWSCDNLSVSPLDKSSLSFSGPYIFCQPVESNPMEEDLSTQTEPSCPDVGCLAPVWTAQFEEGYVRLPSPTASTSMQYPLTESHCSSTDEQSSSHTEEDQHCQSNSSDAFWPPGGATQGSGYCQLPTDFTQM